MGLCKMPLLAKAEDCYSIWACARCHSWLDQGKGSKIEKNAHFDERWPYQVYEWRKIYLDPLARLWKREAAERVLKYLNIFRPSCKIMEA